MQCWDDKRKLVRAQDWDGRTVLRNYEATMKSGAAATDTHRVVLTKARFSVEVVFQDLQSERTQSWQFTVTPPKVLSELQLTRSAPNPGSDGSMLDGTARDTLLLELEVYLHAGRPGAGTRPETLSVRIMAGDRTMAGERLAVTQDSWRVRRRLSFPLLDYPSGDYDVVASVLGKGGVVMDRSQATFHVKGSFFSSEREYRAKVDELLWIATEDQIRKLKTARPAERESLWRAFWVKKDQTPTTSENETESEYFDRIAYCRDHFGHGDKGYRSDRAMVYVKLGPPDNVEAGAFEIDSQPYETWSYYSLNRSFTFHDVNGFGEYKLMDQNDRDFFK